MTEDPILRHRSDTMEKARLDSRVDALIRIYVWNTRRPPPYQIDEHEVISDLEPGEFLAAAQLFNRMARAYYPVAEAHFRYEPTDVAQEIVRAQFHGMSDETYEAAFHSAIMSAR